MDLYKIITQLTEEEFQEIHNNFTANKADKSASFLKIIRNNPDSPDKEFLDKFDNSPSAFYVLKSRLNQKIETYLLNRLGDPNLHVIHKVLNVKDLVFNNPREISIAALRKLEKELLKSDFPYGLMIVYKELQNLHTYDENYSFYSSRYNQQVAYALAMDKAMDIVVQFFRAYDSFFLSRKEEELTKMVRSIEKIDNLNNLYDSHRLYIFKAIVHIFAQLFLEIPNTIRCELENLDTLFDRSLEILEEFNDDTFYSNMNLLFDFLRYSYHEKQGAADKAKIYFEILDYKIEELLTRYHYNVNTSLFLYNKLNFHINNNTEEMLLNDVETYIKDIEMEPYRLSFFVNYHLFMAHTHFMNGNFHKCSRILYNLRNEVNLRKHLHMDLEVKFFLAISYVKLEDFDLANQLILSLQRQLRKNTMVARYEHCKTLLKILTVALGGKPRTRRRNLENNITKWKTANTGRYAVLQELNMEEIFLSEEVQPT